jgi:flagellar biosynthesis chaperone FliJ
VLRGCDLEEKIVKTWEEQRDALEHTSLFFLSRMAENNRDTAQTALEECRDRIANIKASLYDAIEEWEEYWKAPFPKPEVKAKALEWQQGEI